MELKQLEYFTRVAELGSFTRAAQVLDIAQPALSRQVRRLEVELHQNLLHRNGRGVTTTEAGKLLLEHSRGILHQVERAKEDLARSRGALIGRVTLGIPPTASKMMTVQLTRSFRQHLPQANLSISEGLSLMMQEWLLDGRLDIALLYNPNTAAALQLTPLTSEPLYVVGPRTPALQTRTVSLRALADMPLVVPNKPNTVRMLLETQMMLVGRQPSILLEIDGVRAILDLVADGLGYAILARHAVAKATEPEKYRLYPIVEPDLPSRLFLATASSRIVTPTQAATIKLIREVVQSVYPEDLIRMDA